MHQTEIFAAAKSAASSLKNRKNDTELAQQVPPNPRKVNIRLPEKGHSNSHGARPVH